MKHLSRTIAYITLGAIAVVSVLLYACPFSLRSYTPLIVTTVDCESAPPGMQQLGMSPTTGGCFSSHIAAGDDFIATMPKLLGVLFAAALVIALIGKKDLLLFLHTNPGWLMQMRHRYRRHNNLLRFLFENKFRAWLILQQRVVTAH